MEYQNDSVEEILEQLKNAHNEGGARPDKAQIDEILSSLGLEQPAVKPAVPAEPEKKATPAEPRKQEAKAAVPVAEKKPVPPQPKPVDRPQHTAPPPQNRQPEKAAKPVPPAPLRETPQQEVEDRAKSIFEESEGDFVRPSPDIFKGERIDRRQHADELIDEKFYEFFTSSVVMDKEELDRRLREEKRKRKQEKSSKGGLFGFLRGRRTEEDDTQDEVLHPLKEEPPTPARTAMPEDVFAARHAELEEQQSAFVAQAAAPAVQVPAPPAERGAQPAGVPAETPPPAAPVQPTVMAATQTAATEEEKGPAVPPPQQARAVREIDEQVPKVPVAAMQETAPTQEDGAQ